MLVLVLAYELFQARVAEPEQDEVQPETDGQPVLTAGELSDRLLRNFLIRSLFLIFLCDEARLANL